MINIRPKVHGVGVITRRCHICRRPIVGDPVLIQRDGRLLSYHADCHQKEK